MRRVILVSLLLALVCISPASARNLLVSDGGDDGGSGGTGYDGAASDSLATGAVDTSATYSLKAVDKVVLWVQAACDTAALTVQVSYDGTVWTNLVDGALLNGTPGTKMCLYHKVLTVLRSGETVYESVPIGNMMRILMKSNDSGLLDTRSGVKYIKYYMRFLST